MKGIFFLVVCWFIGLVMANTTSRAFTIKVTNTNDILARATLRRAIIFASRFPRKNTIVLDPQPRFATSQSPREWVVHLTIPGTHEDNAWQGDLDVVRGDITIVSPYTNVVIDASDLGDRVFQIFPKARLTLENLTITGGHAPENSWYTGNTNYGGAIYNAGTLTLINCKVVGNSAGNGMGFMGNGDGGGGGDAGAIYNFGTLIMSGCLVTGNAAGQGNNGGDGGNGGGIRNDGFSAFTNCVFANNSSGNGSGPAGNFSGFGGSGGNSGAIYNTGEMMLIGCVITNNLTGNGANGTTEGFGGSFYRSGAPGGHGGNGAGIYNSGVLVLRDCAVCQNLTGNGGEGGRTIGPIDDSVRPWEGHGGSGGNGAGIFNLGRLSLTNCTISGNLCGMGGAGGFGYPDGGTGGDGGGGSGIYNDGVLTLISITVASNVCGSAGAGGAAGTLFNYPVTGGNGGDGGNGGGILNMSSNNAATLGNTLIAGNVSGNAGAGGIYQLNTQSGLFNQTNGMSGLDGAIGIGQDTAGVFDSLGFNLVGNGESGAGLVDRVNSDMIGNSISPIDPLLGPLQTNGGSSPTHALLPGSPAIDQGNSFGLQKDQRGQTRPTDLDFIPNAPGGDASDIGAFEYQVE